MLIKLGSFWEKNTVDTSVAHKKTSMLKFQTDHEAFMFLLNASTSSNFKLLLVHHWEILGCFQDITKIFSQR